MYSRYVCKYPQRKKEKRNTPTTTTTTTTTTTAKFPWRAGVVAAFTPSQQILFFFLGSSRRPAPRSAFSSAVVGGIVHFPATSSAQLTTGQRPRRVQDRAARRGTARSSSDREAAVPNDKQETHVFRGRAGPIAPDARDVNGRPGGVRRGAEEIARTCVWEPVRSQQPPPPVSGLRVEGASC